MHGSQRCCGQLAKVTVSDIWQTADAGDQQLQRLAHSSRRYTLELGAEDNDGLSQQACTAVTEEQPASAGHRASAETDHAHISRSQ